MYALGRRVASRDFCLPTSVLEPNKLKAKATYQNTSTKEKDKKKKVLE